ncbi:MAG: hypothetical protein WCT46_02405 [Candidatus Gracilibacteria bacterium]|jgi:hypothetical protein
MENANNNESMIPVWKIHPFQGKKEGEKYRIIEITDLTFHTAYKKISASPGKQIRKANETNTPGRMYFPIGNKEFIPTIPIIEMLSQDPEFIKMLNEEHEKGYKVLLSLSKELPVFAGKDTEEFIHSKNGKRILRGFAKKKE